MTDQEIILTATNKAKENRDFGISTSTIESAKAYLYIFHNIKK